MRHIVLIGNGIAGITAARHIRKRSNDRITIVSSETPHFFSRPALMYVYMGHLKFEHTKPYEDWFWAKNRIELVHDYAERIDTTHKQVHLKSGTPLSYDVLILATGSVPNTTDRISPDIIGVQGLYSKQDLEHMETATRGISRGVVIGGGLIGIEVAEMLHSRHIPVTMVVRESSYWNSVLPPEESLMINRHIRHQGIDLRLETELQDIQTDDNRHVQSVRTNKSDVIPAEFVALTIGVRPNIGLATASSIPTNRGTCVNEWFETSLPDVYAIGDCAEILDTGSNAGRVEQLWYTAEMHGETVARTICGERTRYERGIFFNSAKFFDIEYQTYGQVNAHVPGEQSLFYEHPDHRRSIRIVYTSEHVIGFNLLGIRYRHAVCEEWIAQKRSIDYVLEHIEQANFDPEFFERFEPALLAAYRQQTGREIHLKKQRSFFGFKQFLRSVSSS